MEVKLDRNNCIGCSLCSEICPEIFAMGEDGLAEIVGAANEGNIEKAKEAEKNCPVNVIEIIV